MDSERSRQIAVRFGPGIGTPPNPSLCDRCVEVMSVHGAGVSIMSGRNSGPVCSSSARVRELEGLQFSLGEGPCHDAFTSGAIISEPDLARAPYSKWPNYAPLALDLGACAVFAFPLQIGVGTVGVLTLYQDSAGTLTAKQSGDGRILARTLPAVMSAIQAAAPQTLMTGALSDADAHRAEIHQAAGMITVQLSVDIEEALVRIRAHAYAVNDTVAHVADAILAHSLYLGNDGPKNRKSPS